MSVAETENPSTEPNAEPSTNKRVDPFDRTIGATSSEGVVPDGDDRDAIGAFDAPSDRFEERGELGRGGMGRVVDVYDHALCRNVAIKHVLGGGDLAMRRFEREVRITAQLEHPGIVPIYETGRADDGTPYYVMRRIDGRPLDQAVRSATLDQRLALMPTVLAACDAVAFAHARNIIHRDLKPSNILIGRYGETLVIDWGLARTIEERDGNGTVPMSAPELTRAGHVAGTPGFMAPEQARGEAIDTRADVYALGATLFYTLTGEPAHPSARPTELISQAAAERPLDWSRIPDGVPEDLRTITMKALASSRANRYDNAGELAADLRRFVTGNLVAAHRYGRIEQILRFIRRHRAAVAVALASLAVIAGIAALALMRVLDERDRADAARVLETDRANDVSLAQAQLLLDKNPTLAVALVQPLADSPRWREARDIVAAASARGVPWRLPGPAATWRAGISSDGRHAFTVGGDGSVWLYDLRARTGVIAAELGRAVDHKHHAIVELLDAGRLAILEGNTLALFEPTGRRTVPIAAPATSSHLAAGTLTWIDRDHKAWRLVRDTTGEHPAAIDVPDEALDVRVSPDGARFVVLGKTATWLVAGGTATKLLDERAHNVAWDPSGARLVVVTYKRGMMLELELGDSPTTRDRIGRGWPDRVVVAPGGLAYFQSDHELLTSERGIAKYVGLHAAGLSVAAGRIVVAGTSDGVIEAFDGTRRQRLVVPPPLDLIVAEHDAPLVLAISGPDVLVFDLDAVFPRIVDKVPTTGPVSAAGPHHVITAARGPSEWIDLQTLARAPGPNDTFVRMPMFDAAPNVPRALFIDDQAALHILRIGTTADTIIARDIALARFVDDHRIAIAGTTGRLALHDLDAGTTTTLGRVERRPRALRTAGNTVAVFLDDASVMRIDLATLTSASLRRPPDTSLSQLTADGRLWFVSGSALRCWLVDGQVVTHVVLGSPITGLFAIDESHVAIDSDETAYIVDLDYPNTLRPTMQLSSQRDGAFQPNGPVYYTTRASAARGFVAVAHATGGARILDALTGVAWQVGQESGEPTQSVFATDGSALWERHGDALAVWQLAIPRTRVETVAAFAQLTNAMLGPDRSTIRWR